jgi:hypothetical protein
MPSNTTPYQSPALAGHGTGLRSYRRSASLFKIEAQPGSEPEVLLLG